jgi:GNAT superfamily N-acetyltransferase
MPDAAVALRLLAAADLAAYKALRDEMLETHPDAFNSDAAEERVKEPADYLHRLGLDRREGGQFVLGAWRAERLVGAIASEREQRRKVRHIAHVIGMMVRPEARRLGIGRALLEGLIGECRQVDGLEMLTLTVTGGNAAAVRLYEQSGFAPYGNLPRAIRLGPHQYRDKLYMMLTLCRLRRSASWSRAAARSRRPSPD